MTFDAQRTVSTLSCKKVFDNVGVPILLYRLYHEMLIVALPCLGHAHEALVGLRDGLLVDTCRASLRYLGDVGGANELALHTTKTGDTPLAAAMKVAAVLAGHLIGGG